MKNIIIIVFILLFSLCNPLYSQAKDNYKLIQQETRIINNKDSLSVMKSAVNTLQDSDFIIEEYVPELGHIKARKEFKQRYINKGRLAGQSALLALATSYAVFTWGSTAAYVYSPTRKITDELHSKNAVVDVNVNVSQFGPDRVKVRVIFVQKILQNAEGFSYSSQAPLKAFRIKSVNVFDEFFNQLEEKI